jgi:hypothetical protein
MSEKPSRLENEKTAMIASGQTKKATYHASAGSDSHAG